MSQLADFRAPGYVSPGEFIPKLTRRIRVLAFDQGLRNTGVVLLDGREEIPEIRHSITLRTKAGQQTGWRSNYAGQVQMAEHMIPILLEHAGEFDVIVHEMPSTKGLSRPDASIMAGMSVRILNLLLCPEVPIWMISKQRAANTLTGNPNAKKDRIPAALKGASWIAGLDVIESSTYREHQYDALALAITALARGED